MKKEVIVKLHASFEESVQKDENGGEYWLARDLQELLGYAKWENFAKVIGLGKGATRPIEDIALTRYAC
jgi:DNA-damage-inducible protein D